MASSRVKDESYEDYFLNRNSKHTYDLVEIFKTFETKLMRDLSSCTLAVVAKATGKNPKKISCTPFPLRNNTEMSTIEVYNGIANKKLKFKKGAIIVVVFTDRDYRNSIDSMSDTGGDSNDELNDLIERSGDSDLHSESYGVAVGLVSNDGTDYTMTEDEGSEESYGTSADEDDILSITSDYLSGNRLAEIRTHDKSYGIYSPLGGMSRVYGIVYAHDTTYPKCFKVITLGTFTYSRDIASAIGCSLRVQGTLGGWQGDRMTTLNLLFAPRIDVDGDIQMSCIGKMSGDIGWLGNNQKGDSGDSAFIDIFKIGGDDSDRYDVILFLRDYVAYDLTLTWNNETYFTPIKSNLTYKEGLYMPTDYLSSRFFGSGEQYTRMTYMKDYVYNYAKFDSDTTIMTTNINKYTEIFPCKRRVELRQNDKTQSNLSLSVTRNYPSEIIYNISGATYSCLTTTRGNDFVIHQLNGSTIQGFNYDDKIVVSLISE